MTLQLACAPNFRDFGGAPTRDGRVVRRGLLFRSEAVLAPTAADAACLEALGVRLVCDLRAGSERSSGPASWWASQGVEILHLDILADIRGSGAAWDALRRSPDLAGARELMRTIYRALPAAAAPHLATLFRRLAGGDAPVLIHCTAGKDRTGYVAAMLLEALGVERAAIEADYLSSRDRLNAEVVAATRRLVVEHSGVDLPEAAMDAIVGVEADYLAESRAAMKAEFGSVEAYLREAAGLDRDTQAALQGTLLEEP